MPDPTPEQIANSLYPTTLSPATGQWHVRQPCMSEIAAALRSYGDARAAKERNRCAKVAESAFPGNVPHIGHEIAAAIRKEPTDDE